MAEKKKLNGWQQLGLGMAGLGVAYGMGVGFLNTYSGDNPKNPDLIDAKVQQNEALAKVESSALKYYTTIGALTRPCSELVTLETQDKITPTGKITEQSDMLAANQVCSVDNSPNDVLAAVTRGRELRTEKDILQSHSSRIDYISNDTFAVVPETDAKKGWNESIRSEAPYMIVSGIALYGMGELVRRKK